ncbi:hypothetical protein CPB84DRAFT_1851176 [Gymnopilus junonius]|uniref:Uncharacterized protein n=1 Tax=Gymnopilus junonius TaxID=109634 RepID=A0A9P5NB45_GYMJU|nr:hypothetical protein CPB84DRAFT_1854118 [Gymnopilus junonius]KAF8882621.1 hypothetical protein CPB84DRAFT_1851176 [Gymnopilus junonius]
MKLALKTLGQVIAIRRGRAESRQIANHGSPDGSSASGPAELQSTTSLVNSQNQTISDTTASTRVREGAAFSMNLLQPIWCIGYIEYLGCIYPAIDFLPFTDYKRAVQNPTTKLAVLEYHLNTTTTTLVSIEVLRARILRQLGNVLEILERMQPLKIPWNAQVTQDLIQCSKDIEHYLFEFSALVHVRNEVKDFKAIVQKFVGSSTEFSTVPVGVVKVIDPTGREYLIPLHFCHSYKVFISLSATLRLHLIIYKQFDKALLALFQGEAKRMKLLRYFIQRGMIDLHFDKGGQDSHRELKHNSWDFIYSGQTIRMRFTLQGCLSPSRRFKCPKCRSCVLVDLSADCSYCEVHFWIYLAHNFYPYNLQRSAGEGNPLFKRMDDDFTR